MAGEEQKTRRTTCKSATTRQQNKIRRLMAEEKDGDVKQELEQLMVKFAQFEKAQDEYDSVLTDNDEREESDKYFTQYEENYIKFLNEAKEWLKRNDVAEVTVPVKAESDNDSNSKRLLNALCLPKIELTKFNGDPLQYHSFIAMFEETVNDVAESDKIKLTRLIQYTSGKAHNAIRACALMDGETGYRQARKILKERFGNDHLVTERLVNGLRDGRPIKSAEELQLFCDDLSNCYTTLKQMGRSGEIENQSYIVQLVNRFQPFIRNRWTRCAMEVKKTHDRYPKFEEFVSFVQDQTTEMMDPIYGKASNDRKETGMKRASTFSSEVHNSSSKTGFKHVCVLCKDQHRLFYCQRFKEMKPLDRLQVVIKHKLCENCLLSNHTTAQCRKNSVCSVPGCGKRHTKFIHISNSSQVSVADENPNVRLLNANVNVNANVYMPVVAARVNGEHDTCVLLDTASSSSFCTRKLLYALKLEGTPVTYSLSTLGDSKDVKSEFVNLTLTSLDREEQLKIFNVYVVDSIPVTTACPEPGIYPHLSGLQLVAGGQDIGLLLGQDNAEALIPKEVRCGKKGEPFACKTMFGWAVNGPCTVDSVPSRKVVSQFVNVSLDERVQTLWQIENEGLVQGISWSYEDKKVVEFWDRECKFVDGHYQIPIPWKPDIVIPNNLSQARSRLRSLKLSLDKKGMFDRYNEEIQKLLQCGYAEIVPCDELQSSNTIWYLPHHAIVTEKKPNKVRVVFDCAAKFIGESLNDKCYQGPDLNSRLLDVLIRFRQHNIAIQADIESMYYQVKVPVEERDALRFLWFDSLGNIIHYRMTGHVFGGTWCASSSIYALRRTVLDDPNATASVHDCVNKSFYVDDCLQSFSDKEVAKSVILGTKSVLQNGGFRLTKFVVNDSEVQGVIPVEDRASQVKEFGSDVQSKTLGVRWDVSKDLFHFDVNVEAGKEVTRRTILSTVAACFDPLGLVSPFVLGGKLLFQEATRLKIPWDESVPVNIIKAWDAWVSTMQRISSLEVPRCIKPKCYEDAFVELHHFSDASTRAYGVCSYLRCVNKFGSIFVLLICSKCKVAPIKSVTIPRLELQAAVLSAKMDQFLRGTLDLLLSRSYFWVDSQLVLCYINSTSKRFHTFVENRVGTIRELTDPEQWFHVSGKDNPADLVTKPQNCDLFDKDRWLFGPKFLRCHKSEWQLNRGTNVLSDADPELKRDANVLLSSTSSDSIGAIDTMIERYSSWFHLKRAIAWLLRFKAYLRGRKEFEPCLTVTELKAAEITLIKYVQGRSYQREIELLSRNLPLHKGSSVISLTPVLDNDGILRVGGRLRNAPVQVCAQPIILPHSHYVSSLIVNEYHNVAHLGTEWIVSEVRRKFWITKIRVVVKSVSNKCFACKKYFARTASQVMADLPLERLEPYNPPFMNTGIDCFGPFLVRQGRATVKRYGCIFTCLSVRAVHVEKLCSLNVDSFICALRRFIARRGVPKMLLCDNGTNFVGASAELKRSISELDCPKVHFECLKQEIKWQFNPPSASHMGGIWERLIRVFRKVITGLFDVNSRMSDEMLDTVFAEVESIINGRPITKVSDDPIDEGALTPNHFLLLGHGRCFSPGQFSLNDMYRKKWRFVQHLVDQFWKRWLRCYVPELQKRAKWLYPQRNFMVGDLVLMSDENSPRNAWPMAVVIEVLKGDDGFVRTVKLKTKSSVFTRPIHKLVLLECTQ